MSVSWTVNVTISCDLTFGCHWERSYRKRKRLMKTLSCVYSSDLWPAPKADIIPQCALIGRQQPLEGRSGFSPGLVTKSHESIQCWLEGSEMITHEEAQYTSHCRVMTSSKSWKGSDRDSVYLVKHILVFGNHRPLEQRFYNTQVQDLISDRHTNPMSGLKKRRQF